MEIREAWEGGVCPPLDLEVGLREIPPNVGKLEHGAMMKHGAGLPKAALHPPPSTQPWVRARSRRFPGHLVPPGHPCPHRTLPSGKVLGAEGEGASCRGLGDPKFCPFLTIIINKVLILNSNQLLC